VQSGSLSLSRQRQFHAETRCGGACRLQPRRRARSGQRRGHRAARAFLPVDRRLRPCHRRFQPRHRARSGHGAGLEFALLDAGSGEQGVGCGARRLRPRHRAQPPLCERLRQPRLRACAPEAVRAGDRRLRQRAGARTWTCFLPVRARPGQARYRRRHGATRSRPGPPARPQHRGALCRDGFPAEGERTVGSLTMKHAVIVAHPNPQSYTAAMASAYREAGLGGGYEVVYRDLYAMGFDPRLEASEIPWTENFALKDDVVAERALLADVDVFVFFYPIWLNSPPSILKGYFERVFGLGFAYRHVGTGNAPLLKGRKMLSFTSSGAPTEWV